MSNFSSPVATSTTLAPRGNMSGTTYYRNIFYPAIRAHITARGTNQFGAFGFLDVTLTTFTTLVTHEGVHPGSTYTGGGEAKFLRLQYTEYTTFNAELREILMSVVSDLLDPLFDPITGLSEVTTNAMLKHLGTEYGTLTYAEVIELHDVLRNLRFNHYTVFVAFCTQLKRLIATINSAGANFTISEFEKQRYLEMAVAQVPSFSKTLLEYRQSRIATDDVTFEGAIKYLTDYTKACRQTDSGTSELDRSAAAVYTHVRAGGTKTDKDEICHLTAENQRVIAENQRLTAALAATQKDPPNPKDLKNKKKYCFLCGYLDSHKTTGHTGFGQDTLTPAQLAATGPGLIDGKQGSKRVR